MSTNTKKKEQKRTEYLNLFRNFAIERGEDARDIGANSFAFPFVFEDGEESFLKVTVQIPSGSRDGEPFDGYAEADSWEFKKQQKAIKAEEQKKNKEKKIARDNEYRAKQKANKERREGQ